MAEIRCDWWYPSRLGEMVLGMQPTMSAEKQKKYTCLGADDENTENLVHVGNKVYLCRFCDKIFANLGKLNNGQGAPCKRQRHNHFFSCGFGHRHPRTKIKRGTRLKLYYTTTTTTTTTNTRDYYCFDLVI